MSAHLVAMDALLSSEDPTGQLAALVVELVARGVAMPHLRVAQWRNGVAVDVIRGTWLGEVTLIPLGWQAVTLYPTHLTSVDGRITFNTKEHAYKWLAENLEAEGWQVLP